MQEKPFPHIIIKNFLSQEEFERLRHVIENTTFTRKDSDLFSLEQTHELSGNPELEFFKEKLLSIDTSELAEGLSEVSMAAMRYNETDYLLCHDDQLEERKIAYLLYVQAPEKGGALALLEDKEPYRRVSIEPEANMVVLFQVSDRSWHEVEEIVKGTRVHIGGWLS